MERRGFSLSWGSSRGAFRVGGLINVKGTGRDGLGRAGKGYEDIYAEQEWPCARCVRAFGVSAVSIEKGCRAGPPWDTYRQSEQNRRDGYCTHGTWVADRGPVSCEPRAVQCLGRWLHQFAGVSGADTQIISLPGRVHAVRAYANRGAQYGLSPSCLNPFTFLPTFPPLHLHPPLHQQASLQVHACAVHLGQEGDRIAHHDDAGCLVFAPAVHGCCTSKKRQPDGRPDTLHYV